MAKKAVIRQVAKKLKVQTIHIPQAISKAGRVINVARLFGCAISDTKAPEKLKSFLNFLKVLIFQSEAICEWAKLCS